MKNKNDFLIQDNNNKMDLDIKDLYKLSKKELISLIATIQTDIKEKYQEYNNIILNNILSNLISKEKRFQIARIEEGYYREMNSGFMIVKKNLDEPLKIRMILEEDEEDEEKAYILREFEGLENKLGPLLEKILIKCDFNGKKIDDDVKSKEQQEKEQYDEIEVIEIGKGIYREVYHGFLLKQREDGSIITTSVIENGEEKERDLTEDEKKIARAMGILVPEIIHLPEI